jgi:AraC-like DNA-binding protein
MLVAPLFAEAFRELSVSVSTWTEGLWIGFHLLPNVIGFEAEYGTEPLRNLYNERSLAQVKKTGRIVIGTHAGHHDLFVPVHVGGRVHTIVVAGPFATKRPTSAAIQERWRRMTHTHARITDPAFSRYLESTLTTLTLEGPLLGTFKKLLSAFARLLGEEGDPDRFTARVRALKDELLETRLAERMWEAAWSMIDEWTSPMWSTPLQADPLAALGLSNAPRHAVVGMLVDQAAQSDPIDAAVHRNAYQRACTELARRRGHTACGRLGDYGAVFLTDDEGGQARVRASLVDLATRAGSLARRFGFRLHVGVADGGASVSIVERYRAAIAAAGSALLAGRSLAFATRDFDPSTQRLRQLRAELGAGVEQAAPELSQRFDRYVEAVLVAGYQRDVARAHLEAGLDRLAEPVLALGKLERRTFDELCEGIENETTLMGLVAAYRRVVADIERSLVNPTSLRRDRSVQRALAFVREHLAESLPLPRVARIAGYAPAHFSRLLKRDQGVSFDRYLQKLRLERAKQTLASTSLDVGAVATLAGFASRTTFQRLFKRSVGVTPARFQKRQGSRPVATETRPDSRDRPSRNRAAVEKSVTPASARGRPSASRPSAS